MPSLTTLDYCGKHENYVLVTLTFSESGEMGWTACAPWNC